MYSTSDEILGKGKKVEGVGDSVVGAQRPAAAATHGFILPMVQSAPKAVQQKARKVNQTTVFASGCVKYWGKGIKTFNDAVDKLNDEWNAAVADDFGLTKPTKPSTSGTPMPGNVRTLETYNTELADFNTQLASKKAAKAKELRSRFTKLETKLDNKAQKIAGMLKKGPDDEKSILTLFGAGALPAMSVMLFPDVPWKAQDYRKMLEEFAKSLPGGRLQTLTPKASYEWFKSLSPEYEWIDEAIASLLTTKGIELTSFELQLIKSRASADSYALKLGLDAKGEDALAEIRAATTRLGLINTYVQNGGKLNSAAVEYIDTWMNGVGAKDLSRVPDVVEEYADKSDVKTYLSPIADAIMNRSNPDKMETWTDERGHPYYVGDLNSDGKVDAEDMPDAVQDLLDTRIRDGREIDASGVDQFKGFVDLINASTVNGGDDFTVGLAESAVHAKRDLNTVLALDDAEPFGGDYDSKDPFGIDAAASDLLSVVGRNEDASAKVLLDTDLRRSIIGMNWHDGQGAADVIHSGTASGENGRNALDGTGASELQARAAYAVMREISADGAQYESRAHEKVSDAIVDVGISWIDTFTGAGKDSGVDPYGDDARLAHKGEFLEISLNDEDRKRFLRFVSGAGEDDAVRFHASAFDYSSKLLADAIESGDKDSINAALVSSGQLEGGINGADKAVVDDQDHAERRAAQAATIATSFASTAGGAALPGAAPFLSVGNAAATPIIEDVLTDDDAARKYEEIEKNATLYKALLYSNARSIADTGHGTTNSFEKIVNDDDALLRAQAEGASAIPGKADESAYGESRKSVFNAGSKTEQQENREGWGSQSGAGHYLYGDGYLEEQIPVPDGGPGGRGGHRRLPTVPGATP